MIWQADGEGSTLKNLIFMNDKLSDNFTQLLSQYDYRLPPELVALVPARPRDSARLLVYRRSKDFIDDAIFSHLSQYLPSKAIVVLNETKVIPARLTALKPSGGAVRLLYTGCREGFMEVLSDRRVAPGMVLIAARGVRLEVASEKKGVVRLRPSFPLADLPAMMQKLGETPLPPYLKRSPLTEARRRREYQAVFAKEPGSVAAPTASLHFTRRLMMELEQKGVEFQYVTLHVNLGTFATLKAEQVLQGKLHEESYSISDDAAEILNRAKREGRPIIASGTTAARALETAAAGSAVLKNLQGTTRLFIRPGYDFAFVDGLITNFHVPQSSLLMLVAALTGREKLMGLYRHAISEKYRFFSFGDAMLII